MTTTMHFHGVADGVVTWLVHTLLGSCLYFNHILLPNNPTRLLLVWVEFWIMLQYCYFRYQNLITICGPSNFNLINKAELSSRCGIANILLLFSRWTRHILIAAQFSLSRWGWHNTIAKVQWMFSHCYWFLELSAYLVITLCSNTSMF